MIVISPGSSRFLRCGRKMLVEFLREVTTGGQTQTLQRKGRLGSEGLHTHTFDSQLKNGSVARLVRFAPDKFARLARKQDR
jgi:hypothetical protein